MNRVSKSAVKMLFGMAVAVTIALGADQPRKKNMHNVHSAQVSTIQNDIAFVSVMGSRPDAEKLQGFQYAVLYNARGEVVRRFEVGKDSIYSLDRMIQENRSRGPLVVRMYHR